MQLRRELVSTRAYGIIGVVALVVVIALALVLGRSPGGSASASAQPSASETAATESAAPSETATVTATATEEPMPTASPSPEPTLAAAPRIAWERIPGPVPGASIFDLAFLEGGRVLAVGHIELVPAIWFSDDAGGSWTAASIQTQRSEEEFSVVSEVVTLGQDLLAIGHWGRLNTDQFSRVVWRSSDGGLTWTERRDNSGGFVAIVSGGPGLVAAGLDGAPMLSGAWIGLSADGESWQRAELPDGESAFVSALAVVGERLVAVGNRVGEGGRPVAAAWFSNDQGVTWQAATGTDENGAADTGRMTAVAEVDGRLVAVGGSGTPLAWTSSDGMEWVASEMGGGSASPEAIARLQSGLLAVGMGGGNATGPAQAWTSVDGVSWTLDDPLGDGSVSPRAIATLGGTVLVGGYCLTDACEFVLWRGVVADPALAP